MIPRAYITEWSSVVPWKTDEQIEQDLIICLLNLDKKMRDSEFFGDLEALVRPDESFDWQEAYKVVRERLIERI